MLGEDPAANLLGLLQQVRSSRFSSVRLDGSTEPTSGEGVVTTSLLGSSSIDFVEAGAWSAANGTSFRFHNAHRWVRLSPTSLRLEQIRLGPKHPVHLVDLTPADAAATVWLSVKNHHCGDDTYTARLTVHANRLVLAWQISGPRKNDFIESTYLLSRAP